jgi:hypothetical protein
MHFMPFMPALSRPQLMDCRAASSFAPHQVKCLSRYNGTCSWIMLILREKALSLGKALHIICTLGILTFYLMSYFYLFMSNIMCFISFYYLYNLYSITKKPRNLHLCVTFYGGLTAYPYYIYDSHAVPMPWGRHRLTIRITRREETACDSGQK